MVSESERPVNSLGSAPEVGDDPRLAAFRACLDAIDRRDGVIPRQRDLRKLGFSVCVTNPRASCKPDPAPVPVTTPGIDQGTTDDEPDPRGLADGRPLASFEVDRFLTPGWHRAGPGDPAIGPMYLGRDDWSTIVMRAAARSVAPRLPYLPGSGLPLTGPVRLEATFTTAERPDAWDGSPWAGEVPTNGIGAESGPDLGELVTALVGAISGVLVADETRVCRIAARKVHGPTPGIRAALFPL